jgi:hypothetical protein
VLGPRLQDLGRCRSTCGRPDVYEGAPTPITAFFAGAPKVAAICLFTRVLVDAFGGITHQWQQIIFAISIASMILGAFAAIGQRSVKRLMAYSSIGNIGYALVGLAAGTQQGVSGLLFYMAIYVAMTVGSFAVILAMRQKGQMVEEIADLSGLAKSQPWLAHIFAAILFSMAGIPPLAGFFGKWMVFVAAVDQGLFVACGIARRHQRGLGLLLCPSHQGDVFRRSGRQLRPGRWLAEDRARRLAGGGGGRHPVHQSDPEPRHRGGRLALPG